MSGNTTIEWTGKTWNPITGCTKISTGCKYCYAERMAHRLKPMGNPRYKNEFELTLHEDLLDVPLKWKKPQKVFVNSMSDLFHEDVPLEFIEKVFNTMNKANWHHFQILTKRSERLLEFSPKLSWAKNIWQGVSIESEDYLFRMDHLKQTDAHVKFLSLEPLLGPLSNMDLDGISWVILGGESGPGSRPMDKAWGTDIRDQCIEANVPFFFKQWGGTNKKKTGRVLDGRVYNEFPEVGVMSV